MESPLYSMRLGERLGVDSETASQAYNGLPGLSFPGRGHPFSSKDEVADYLEAYAARFEFPVLTGVRVNRLSRNGSDYVVQTSDRIFEAETLWWRCQPSSVRRRLRSRVVDVRDGVPLLDGERVLEVDNVIWCTGFHPDFSWIDLLVFGEDEARNEPIHHRGIVADQPGLYFVGLFFLSAMSSGFLPGIGRDAAHVVKGIASRTR